MTAGTQPRRSWPVRLLVLLAAALATVVALLTGAVILGAFVPAVPKAGIIGPVLGGQYPLHMAVIALVGVGLSVLTVRGGLRRWGRVTLVLTAVATAGSLVIAGTQLTTAMRVGTQVRAGEVFTELAYPAVSPDSTQTYAVQDGQMLNVDVYLPRRSAGAPAVVLAHAGGFHTFDKSDLRGTGRWLADHGVAVFAIDYRLARPGDPTWEKAPHDLATALRWVQDRAGTFGVDSSRIALGGMSAGGTLALDTAYRLANGTLVAPDVRPAVPPAAVVGFYPGVDVTELWQRDVGGSRNGAELFTGGTPQEYPQRYREVSPTAQVRAGAPRTLLVVGDRDRSAPTASVLDFGSSLHSAGVDATTVVLPFAEHAFDDAYGSLTSQTSRQVLLAFLTR